VILALSLTVCETWPVFGWKMHVFPTPIHSTPNLKMFPLNCIPQILYTKEPRQRLIICVKVFPWDLPESLNTSVAHRQSTDDNRARPYRRLYSIAVARQKCLRGFDFTNGSLLQPRRPLLLIILSLFSTIITWFISQCLTLVTRCDLSDTRFYYNNTPTILL